MPNIRSFSLYFHIPFCLRKCGYCDFVSIEDMSCQSRYFWCCGIELESVLKRYGHKKIVSIYFGGGTPSAVDPDRIAALLNFVFPKKEKIEITIEANPNSFSREKWLVWKQAGVNRLSLGIQSFDHNILSTLGRLHNPEEGIRAFQTARKAGCKNIGIDLMFGIPGQTLETWRSTLRTAIGLRPEHISVYGLTVAEGTPFCAAAKTGRLRLPSSGVYNRMFFLTHETLTAAGYEHYEISNYALPGYRSRHNSRYWEGEDCVGIGAAAHSILGKRRWANTADVEGYCTAVEHNTDPVAWQERVGKKETLNEAIMLGLRKAEGVSRSRLISLGFPQNRESVLNALRRQKLIESSPDRIALTLKGMTVADEIIARLLK